MTLLTNQLHDEDDGDDVETLRVFMIQFHQSCSFWTQEHPVHLLRPDSVSQTRLVKNIQRFHPSLTDAEHGGEQWSLAQL